MAGCGSRQIQRTRRLSHMLSFGDGDEYTKLLKCHAGAPSISMIDHINPIHLLELLFKGR